MKLIKPCGCEVDLQPIPGYVDTTAAPMQETPIFYCEHHTHDNETKSFQDEIIDNIND